jgi:hypothetical protein
MEFSGVTSPKLLDAKGVCDECDNIVHQCVRTCGVVYPNSNRKLSRSFIGFVFFDKRRQ